MAKIKAGKKIRSALKTFQQQRTKRVEAVAGAVSDIVAARQAGKTARTGFRQQGKVGKAEAISQGGGFIGRQDTIGIGFQTAGKLGTAAASLEKEGFDGAKRFAGGKGRGGNFEDI